MRHFLQGHEKPAIENIQAEFLYEYQAQVTSSCNGPLLDVSNQNRVLGCSWLKCSGRKMAITHRKTAMSSYVRALQLMQQQALLEKPDPMEALFTGQMDGRIAGGIHLVLLCLYFAKTQNSTS